MSSWLGPSTNRIRMLLLKVATFSYFYACPACHSPSDKEGEDFSHYYVNDLFFGFIQMKLGIFCAAKCPNSWPPRVTRWMKGILAPCARLRGRWTFPLLVHLGSPYGEERKASRELWRKNPLELPKLELICLDILQVFVLLRKSIFFLFLFWKIPTQYL